MAKKKKTRKKVRRPLKKVEKTRSTIQRLRMLFVLLIIIASTMAIAIISLTITAKASNCGDDICGPGETTQNCPNDCHCDDATFDEVIGEWSGCNSKQQKRIVQNSCDDTKVETRACVAQPTTQPQKVFTVTANKFLDQIKLLNKEIKASISAYNDGIITAGIFKSRLDSASSESLLLYYDVKNMIPPSEYENVYTNLNKAVASQLSGLNEIMKYFEDNNINHLYSGENWMDKSDLYAEEAAVILI